MCIVVETLLSSSRDVAALLDVIGVQEDVAAYAAGVDESEIPDPLPRDDLAGTLFTLFHISRHNRISALGNCLNIEIMWAGM